MQRVRRGKSEEKGVWTIGQCQVESFVSWSGVREEKDRRISKNRMLCVEKHVWTGDQEGTEGVGCNWMEYGAEVGQRVPERGRTGVDATGSKVDGCEEKHDQEVIQGSLACGG